MKLYFNPQSRAVVSKWMLDECGAEYELPSALTLRRMAVVVP
jgi:predicted RNA-binding protein with PUA-like domain